MLDLVAMFVFLSVGAIAGFCLAALVRAND